MKPSRVLMAVVASVILAISSLVGPTSAGHPQHHHADNADDAVVAWNKVAVDTLSALPGPAGGAPPAAQVHVAMVQGAVYDAVNATEPRHHRSYALGRRFSLRASQEAAVAAAAYGVLHAIVTGVPNITPEARAAVLGTLATTYAGALAPIPEGAAKRKGIAAGTAAAAAMLAERQGDGRFGPSPWVPSTAPGHWSPSINPATGQPVLDPTPWVGNVDPFTMHSTSQFRTPGPLALTSTAYARELNEVKGLGEATSTTRSATQTYVARWWQSSPVGLWNAVATDLAQRGGLDALDTARILALSNLSAADAAINCWNDKYHYDFWRPQNAIQRAAEDGNPATTPQAGWTPLITAPYPEHPSGHLCLDGAHTRVLRMFFGDTITGGYQLTSVSTLLGTTDARTRTFSSFTQALDELVEARIWAGLHFRTGDVQARVLGEKVAEHAAGHFLDPCRRHGRSMHRAAFGGR